MASCNPEAPCNYYEPCVACAARSALTNEDWYLIHFYRLVASQVDMNGNPRIEAYEVALRTYEYPKTHWATLMSGSMTLHRLISKQDVVDWPRETGKRFDQITKDDVN